MDHFMGSRRADTGIVQSFLGSRLHVIIGVHSMLQQ